MFNYRDYVILVIFFGLSDTIHDLYCGSTQFIFS